MVAVDGSESDGQSEGVMETYSWEEATEFVVGNALKGML